MDAGPQGGLVNVKGQLSAVILPQKPPILFIGIMDGVNSSGIDAHAQRGVPISGIAAGHSEIAPKRTVYIGELGVWGDRSPFRNIGQRHLDAEVCTGHGTERLDRDAVRAAGKLVIFKTSVNAVAKHQMVIKNSPGHAARAVKAGRAEAIPLHSIDLDAALCIEEGPEQDAAQRTAVFHRGAQICNERLQHGVDAVGSGTAGNNAFHFKRGQTGQLRCNTLGKLQAVQGVLAAVAPRSAGIVHLRPQDDRILHAVG